MLYIIYIVGNVTLDEKSGATKTRAEEANDKSNEITVSAEDDGNLNNDFSDAVTATISEVTIVEYTSINDELCIDEEFIENDGKTAFKCLQCKMFFLPGSFMYGNEIAEYDLCRTHLGVTKCEMCAMDLIGLDKIRVHRAT